MYDAHTGGRIRGRNVYDRFCYKVDSLCRASSRDSHKDEVEKERDAFKGAPLPLAGLTAVEYGDARDSDALHDERSRACELLAYERDFHLRGRTPSQIKIQNSRQISS